jgi:PncC family amidohydrolase
MNGQPPAEEVVKRLSACGKTLVTAESCTAGLVADAIARVAGASKVLWGGFIAYTVNAKAEMFGIDEDFREKIEKYGAVNEETASAMARGALNRSCADIAIAVTGLAGPDGDGSAIKVGTVWIASAFREKNQENGIAHCQTEVFHFAGERNKIRALATEASLQLILKIIDSLGNYGG